MTDLPYPLIHRFFHSVHTSGVLQMDIMLGAPNGDASIHIIDCNRASIIYRFRESQVNPGYRGNWTNKQLVWDGPLKAVFKGAGGDLKIEKLEIGCEDFLDLVPRGKLPPTIDTSNRSLSPDTKRSPLLSQMGRSTSDDGRGQKSTSDINYMGIPHQLMSFLEVTPQPIPPSNSPFRSPK